MTLANLASVSRRLIADAHQESATSEFNQATTATPQEEEERPDEFRGFSTTDKFEFEQVVSWMIDNVFGGTASGQTTLIDSFIEDWAVKWRQDQGLASTDQPDRTPTVEDLLGLESFRNGAAWLPLLSQRQDLPPFFRTAGQSEEGEPINFTVKNDPLTGIEFIEEPVLPEFREEIIPGLRVPIERVTDAASDRAIARAAAGQTDQPVETPSDSASDRAIARAAAGEPERVETIAASDRAIARARNELPFIDLEELNQRLNPSRPTGGRGGGGGTRRDFVVDRDQLLARAEEKWGRWLRETPPEGRVAGIVDSYISEAGAFWRGKGGQLDFDTFLETKLKSQPRYQLLFRNLPPGVSPEQHIASFEQPISQLGLRPELAFSQSTRAITSGGGPGAQFQRVSRTREAQLGGGFSQRLARTLAGLS